MQAKDIQVGKTYRLDGQHRRLKRVSRFDRESHYAGGLVFAKDVLDDGTLRPNQRTYAGKYFAEHVIECVEDA